MIGIKNKSVGFYIGLVACILMIVNLIEYNYVPFDIYKLDATLWTFGGIVAFLIVSCIKPFADLAPVLLMVSSFMSLVALVQAPGTIDYFSTAFFDGFSANALFALPTAVWVSILTFIASFATASIAMYLPYLKRK